MSLVCSRRHVLAATVGLPFASGQVAVDSFAVASGSGLKMVRHGDPHRPAIALFLPNARHPSAIVEMPEHAWRKEKADGEQAWFYKMYTSDRALRAAASWEKDSNRLSFSMKTPSNFTLNAAARLETDGVVITYEVTSGSMLQLAAVEATTCVKLYRPFTDIFLERTYIHAPAGLELIASETADRIGKNAEEWLPCRYIARVAKNAPPAKHRVERLDGVVRHFRSLAADAAFLATESQPSGWTAATHSIRCDSVFTNPARTCHHADPRALAVTDGRAVLRLKVYLLKGTPRDVWDIVAERERAGQV